MKKIVSLVFAAMMILATFTMAFSASAAGKDPAYTADKSVLSKSTKFYSNHLEQQSKMFDHNYGKLIDFGGKTPVFKSDAAETEAYINNKDLWGAASTSQWGVDNEAVSILGIATADAYVTIQGAVNNDKKALKSFIITVPANKELENSLFEGFTIFAGDEEWNEREGYNKGLSTPSGRTFTEVAKVDKITWTTSADGSFKFYEANFAAPVSNEFLAIAFTAANFANAKKAFTDGKVGEKVLVPISEFAAFEGEIAAPSTPDTPETGDAAILFAVISVAVVGLAVTVVIKRREEN